MEPTSNSSEAQGGLDLAKLENVKHLAGGQIRAACPACRAAGSDKSRDHLLIQADGKYGCAACPDDHEHRKEIYRLAGIPMPTGHTSKRNGSPGRIVETYPYHDAAGKVLFEVVRFDPKDFRQRKPDATALDSWTWNTKGVQKVLFRLPEILRAIEGGKFIFVTEGEKDALAMAKLGLAATCNPGGAGKWQDAYTQTLNGANVVIIADKDEAGRAHAATVAGKLHGKAKSVCVIELPDTGGRFVKDAADYFGAGATIEDFTGLLDAAPEWEPPAEGESLLIRLAARLYDPDANLIRPAPRYVLGTVTVCTVGNLTTITAQAKQGKTATIGGMMASTFAEQDADCFGFNSKNESGHAVIHLDCEQSPYDHGELVRLIAKRAGRPLPVWLRSYCLTGYKASDVRAAIPLLMEQENKRFGGVHSVLIDGVADGAEDVNDPQESNAIVAELLALAIKYNCVIVCVIHLNPGSDFKTRGHLGSQLERKAETNFKAEKDDEIITLWAEKNRHAPILKTTGPRFAWDNDAGMHLSVESRADSKANLELEQLTDLFQGVFSTRPAMSFTDLKTTVKKAVTVGDRTAERKIAQAVTLEILKKTFAGLYELKG
jgi:hypothetical protein